MNVLRFFSFSGLFFTLFFLTGCFSFGPSKKNVKSQTFRTAPPPAPWRSVDPGQADLAYQLPGGKATMTLNSVCHQYLDYTLEELTKQLLVGISRPVVLRQAPLPVAGTTGLQTVLEGQANTTGFHMSVVVVRSHECIFDISLIARPEHFTAAEPTYNKFIESFTD